MNMLTTDNSLCERLPGSDFLCAFDMHGAIYMYQSGQTSAARRHPYVNIILCDQMLWNLLAFPIQNMNN